MPRPDHPGQWPAQRLQGLERPLAAGFLGDDQSDRGHGPGHQEQTLPQIAEDQIEQGRADEQQEHRLTQGLGDDAQDTASRS